jgi:hypothetical protein
MQRQAADFNLGMDTLLKHPTNDFLGVCHCTMLCRPMVQMLMHILMLQAWNSNLTKLAKAAWRLCLRVASCWVSVNGV